MFARVALILQSAVRASANRRAMAYVPAVVGDAFKAVDTPALLLDMDLFDANCHTLARRLRAARANERVTVRPHAKVCQLAHHQHQNHHHFITISIPMLRL
jgi:D-serine deaminase-like pyridoxal phosphate-dependent protein